MADTIAAAARAMDAAEPVTFLRHFGDDDLLHRGPTSGGTMFLVPGIWSAMPPRLLATVRARRACSITGRCSECGGCADLVAGMFPHEYACNVPDDRLRPIAAAWFRDVGKFARGRRLIEVPGQPDHHHNQEGPTR